MSAVAARPCLSPPVSRRKRLSKRAVDVLDGQGAHAAAANSIASGMPSRREHSRARAGAFWFVTAKSGKWKSARSTNRRTASNWLTLSTVDALVWDRAGRGRERDRSTPRRCPTPSRLLARISMRGRRAAARCQVAAQAASRCSQLSSTSRRRLHLRCSISVCCTDCPACSCRSTPERRSAAPETDRPGEPVPPARRHPGTAPAPPPPACKARRVLPLPPLPVRVSRRLLASRLLISAISFSLPMKEVSC